ncbi:glycerol kinase [Litorilituus lipolyticus]|uniref:Glycerol kinase n=1 Tax=Litorilituus lipolyticus TaxID=2491017 RepID=A0A502KVV3_9GAMM|nr:glycerol kinase [Litorilituus lipolyticus]TPH15742.1 glycerol kinase [Litorilituus lipolyticus]
MKTVIKANNQYTAKIIGTHFGLESHVVNNLLLKIGFLTKASQGHGYYLTQTGLNKGGEQLTDTIKGISSVRWPESILHDQHLGAEIAQLKGTAMQANTTANKKEQTDFRKLYPANIRTSDGHYVRSKAEAMIDDFLFNHGIVHAYEKKLPVIEDLVCDFFLPQGKVWIEYWGFENKPEYLDRKKKKQAIYQKYGVNLIELTDKDIQNLDDVLPQKLLTFGIQLF